MEFQYGIRDGSGMVFPHPTEKSARDALRATRNVSRDKASINLVRRPMGTWEIINEDS